MVVLNFTLLVELGLFLVFLAGCHFVIFRPVLRQLDRREDKIAEDVQHAKHEHANAVQLEEEYERQLAAARRAMTEELRREQYTAQQEQDAQVLGAKKEAEGEVERACEAAQQAIDAQRGEIERQVPVVATAIAKKLGLGDIA